MVVKWVCCHCNVKLLISAKKTIKKLTVTKLTNETKNKYTKQAEKSFLITLIVQSKK